MKQKLQKVGEHAILYRDTITGIAWVEDGSTGCGHSCHPNIDVTGNVRGMRRLGWGKDERVVRSHGFKYNVDLVVVSDEYDEIARQNCLCGGKH